MAKCSAIGVSVAATPLCSTIRFCKGSRLPSSWLVNLVLVHRGGMIPCDLRQTLGDRCRSQEEFSGSEKEIPSAR